VNRCCDFFLSFVTPQKVTQNEEVEEIATIVALYKKIIVREYKRMARSVYTKSLVKDDLFKSIKIEIKMNESRRFIQRFKEKELRKS